MILLYFFVFLFVYDSKVNSLNKNLKKCYYNTPNCNYELFEKQVQTLKYENKKIRERLQMLELLLDSQTEDLMEVDTILQEIQKKLKELEKPQVQVVTTPKPPTQKPDNYPTDCSQYNSRFCEDNKCRIKNRLYGKVPFLVSCDDVNDGGGWIVIQRRINGSVDFYRNWAEYKNGFGNIDGEFFIGLDKLYALTNTLNPLELYVLLEDFKGKYKYAKYDRFVVGSESQKYQLRKVGKYWGNAGNSFSQHAGSYFTTRDRDNDIQPDFNCAIAATGAWWYNKCFWSNLNGIYFENGVVPKGKKGISWGSFHGYNYSMKFVQMMIRPLLRGGKKG